MWEPSVRVTASTVAEDDEAGLALLVCTEDRRLWRLEWSGKDTSKPHASSSIILNDRARRVRVHPKGGGHVLLSGECGLYLVGRDGKSRCIAEGGHQDARIVTTGGLAAIVAITSDGAVVRYR